MYTVIAENDESQWRDDTGILYHFPKRYLKMLEPGTRVIYYKGKIRDKKYQSRRLSDHPHYFAAAVVGKVYPDKNSTSRQAFFATIEDFTPFEEAVLSKTDSGYLETIPANRVSNFWRDGVRESSKDVYDAIMALAKVQTPEASIHQDKATLDELESYEEGNAKQVYVTKYERNPKLRAQAISIHGLSCKACGFNFGDTYGEYGKGLIHVHHIKPISEAGGSIKVDPETDLVPVCANCHTLIHRKKDKTLSIDEVKAMLS